MQVTHNEILFSHIKNDFTVERNMSSIKTGEIKKNIPNTIITR